MPRAQLDVVEGIRRARRDVLPGGSGERKRRLPTALGGPYGIDASAH
jgi:hypothetical protein